MSAEFPAGARIHPQPDLQPVEPLPAATVNALATLLAHMIVADLTRYPPGSDPGGRPPRGSEGSRS